MTTGEPFPAPTRRADPDLRAFLVGAPIGMFAALAYLMVGHADGRMTAALGMDLIEDGELPPAAVKGILKLTHPQDPGPLTADTLRLAASVRARHGIDPGPDSVHSLIAHAANGLNVFSADEHRRAGITTAEQLASGTAVVAFILQFSAVKNYTTSGMANGTFWRKVVNRWLDDLLRERPGDTERILSYVEERGIRPSSKRDVDQLRAWLDEEPSTLAAGWL